MHKSTRKVVLAGADAICFVADSQRSSASANAYSWRDMEANLKSHGIDFDALPKVVQFNKRDCPDVKPLSARSRSSGATFRPIRPSRLRGEGVLETFRELMRGLYRSLDEQARLRGQVRGLRGGLPEGRPEELPARGPRPRLRRVDAAGSS